MQIEERTRMDALKRFAVPITVVVMVWIGLGMLLQVGQFLLVNAQGVYANAGWSPFGPWEAAVLALVTSATVLWAQPRQGLALALGAVVLAAVGVILQVGSLVVSVVNLLGGFTELGFTLLEALRLVLNLVLPVLALIWLVKLRGAVGAAVAGQPALPPATGPAPAWEPGQAAGAHWQTASGAATGSAASSWGTPGQRGGWGPPASRPPELGPAGARTPTRPQGETHQPRGPEQFGPQELARHFGRPSADDPEQTQSAHPRQPPKWTPLGHDDP